MSQQELLTRLMKLEAGPELDREVGLLVYGESELTPNGWSPSTDARHAEAIYAGLQDNWGITIKGILYGGWRVELGESQRVGGVRYGEGTADTMPLAICRAVVDAFLSR